VERGIELSDDDILRRYIITRIMCDFELDFGEVEKRFNLDFKTSFVQELEALRPLEEDGLLTIDENKIIVSDLGRILIRNIAMNFDAYLRRPEKKMRFSKTI